MNFYDRTPDRDLCYTTPNSRSSGGFDGSGILLLAAALGVALIMMFYPGDGRVGVTNGASPTFKTPPPPSHSASRAKPTPKPTTEPRPTQTTIP
jgi:hypothetical protein